MKSASFAALLLLFQATVSVVAQPFVKGPIIDMGGTFGAIHAADYDGDGDDDLISSGQISTNFAHLILWKLTDKEFEAVTGTGLPATATNARWLDYDGDNDPDLFVEHVERSGSRAFFYENEGGVFTKVPNNLPVTYSFAVYEPGDYDNDGDYDIAFFGNNLVFEYKAAVFRNDNGVYTEVATIPAFSVDGFAWADIDNDSDKDLLVVDFDHAVIYENQSGEFSPIAPTFPGGLRGAHQWEDFDKDNDLDLLITGFASHNNIPASHATIMVNNGDKTFMPYPDIGMTPTEQGTTQWIDLDGDDDLDIFHSGLGQTPSGIGFIVEVFLRNGTSYEPVSHNVSGIFITQFGFVDYDGDNDLDLVAGNDQYQMRVYRNEIGGDTFLPVNDTPGWPVALVAIPTTPTQINLTFRDQSDNEHAWYIEIQRGENAAFEQHGTTASSNAIIYEVTGLTAGVKYGFRVRGKNGTGFGRYSSTVYAYTASSHYSKTDLTALTGNYLEPALVDIDVDGDLDIVATLVGTQANNYSSSSVIFSNNAGVFTQQAHNLPNMRLADMDWTDFDLDGDPDVLMSGNGDASVDLEARTHLLVNNGNFTFTPFANINPRKVRSSISTFMDINNDGYKDIVISGSEDHNNLVHSNQVLINNKGLSFTEIFNTNLPVFYQTDATQADFDQDGFMDLAISGISDSLGFSFARTCVFLNQRNLSFKKAYSFPATSYNPGIAAGDLDSDGKPDLVVNGEGLPMQIYWNTGSGFLADNFHPFPELTDPQLLLGDLNNDGQLDILYSGGGSLTGFTNKVLINQGNRSFVESNIPLDLLLSANYALGDVDGDNDIDVLQLGNNYFGSIASIIKNNSPATNSIPASPTITSLEQVGGQLIMEWTDGADESTSLTSNIYVKTPDGQFLFNGISDNTTGKLTSAIPGNNSYTKKAIVNGLVIGTYEVGVQNVDHSYSGSPFATAELTTTLKAPLLLTEPVGCLNRPFALEVVGSDVTWYTDAALTTSAGTGSRFSINLLADDQQLFVTQKFGTQTSPVLHITIDAVAPVAGGISKSATGLLSPEGNAYQWYRNDTLLVGETNRELQTSMVAKYRLKVTNGPCVTDTLKYTLRPASPSLTFTSQLCVGGKQTATATGTGVTWYNREGANIGTGNTLEFNNLGVGDTVVYATQNINLIESPKAKASWKTYVYPDDVITLQASDRISASPGMTYQWFAGDQAIAGATNRDLVGMDDGVYSVLVANGTCSTKSDPFTYTGVDDEQKTILAYDVRNKALYIESIVAIQRVVLYDITGRVVFASTTSGVLSHSIPLPGLSSAMYVAEVSFNDGQVHRGKFVKP